MESSKKWYDKKGLLVIFLLTIFPIGLIGVWLRDSPIIKKIVYSFIGFWAWLFNMFFLAIVLLIIFVEEKKFEKGEAAFQRKDYIDAVDYYSRVDTDNENYPKAQMRIEEIKSIQAKEKLQREEYTNKALQEVRSSIEPFIENKKNYAVILYDMLIEVPNTDTVFQHKYKVVLEDINKQPYDTITSWISVSDTTFDYYSQDLDMEILSMNENEEIAYSAPPGYNRYVGNMQYGEWKQDDNGDTFWAFYGKYAFLQSMFGHHYPIYNYDYYSYLNDYKGKSSYYGSYTASGKYAYGTDSRHSSKIQGRNTFSERVRQRVARSSSSSYTSQRSYVSRMSSNASRSSYNSGRAGARYSSSSAGGRSVSGGK